MKTINYKNSRKKIVEKFSKRFCDSGAIFHVEEFFDMLLETKKETENQRAYRKKEGKKK